jgi:hypothetical protein
MFSPILPIGLGSNTWLCGIGHYTICLKGCFFFYEAYPSKFVYVLPLDYMLCNLVQFLSFLLSVY